MSESTRYRSLGEFYPFYMSEHTNRACRRLHFVGTTAALALIVGALLTGRWWLVLVGLLVGYAFAWSGHYFFEHNRPATFQYPWLSFLGDLRMWWTIISGRMPF
jgi:hypothetical protein